MGSLFRGLLALLFVSTTPAAELPAHRALRVLIVSDEVNPHGLTAAELTQPGDLSFALAQTGAGIRLEDLVEIPTNSIEQATAVLDGYDVLIYFAHRIPNDGNDDQGRQDAFVAAVDGFLQNGGGVVSFHHGAYLTAGKEGILDLIGATATGAVPFDTVDGQNVVATAPDHWIACRGVEYGGTLAYADAGRGVPNGTYPFFNNTPDERYPTLDYNPSAAGDVETLFGSDYTDNGSTHLLGWVHRRPAWTGRVVGYQPGEYQPLALDDLDGNNFQLLANAILFAAGVVPEDQILLQLDKGAGGAAELSWSACDGTFDVYRSTDPSTVADPASFQGQTTVRLWNDPPSGGVAFYLVTGS